MSDSGPRGPRPEPRKPRPKPDDFGYDEIFAPDPPQPSALEKLKGNHAIRRAGILIVLLIAIVVVASLVMKQFNPSGQPGDEVIVQVPQGATQNQIAGLLQSKGVIPQAWAFRVWDKIDGRTVQFQAGEYSFKSRMSDKEAFDVLAAGPKETASRITIPEGYRVNQIADKVGTIKGFSAEKFKQAVASGTVRSRYQPEGQTSLEGFLFPDTYLISPGDTEVTLLQQMVSQFDSVASQEGLDSSLTNISQTPYDALKIASMVEAEAKTPGDRGKISRVIQNRLFQAMPLQIDATVMYGAGNVSQSLTQTQLRTDTAWNTYTRKGLPATPICSPGRASIDAALHPTSGDWLYYVVADAAGNHAFATTLAEHNANVAAAKAKGLL